jgi:hypothetical protein
VFLIELMIDMIIDMWFYAMERIVPEKTLSKGTRIVLKLIVSVFSLLLFMTMVLGIFAVISDDPSTRQAGRCMIFIPLGISAVQILLGIAVRKKVKK